MLGDGEQRRDVVAGMGVFGREVGVVKVELADGDPIGPRRPLGRDPLESPEHVGTRRCGVPERLRTGVDHGHPPYRSHRDSGVVDDPVDDHLRDVVDDRHRIGGDQRQSPGKLVLLGEAGPRLLDLDDVLDHRGRTSRSVAGR